MKPKSAGCFHCGNTFIGSAVSKTVRAKQYAAIQCITAGKLNFLKGLA